MKKNILNVVLLVFGMNCYSNNTLPINVSLLSHQDYQQDSRFAYIEHRGRREWIRVTITFEKQEGQEKWKAVKVTDNGEFSQNPSFRFVPNAMESPIMKLNPNNQIAIQYNYNYYVDTPYGKAYFNL
jgi:hypothetical protein